MVQNVIDQDTVLKAEMTIPLRGGGKIVLSSRGMELVGTKQAVKTPKFVWDINGIKGFDAQGSLAAQWDASNGEFKSYLGESRAPANVNVVGRANGLNILLQVSATENISSATIAELRAYFVPKGDPLPLTVDLRTAEEGGTFAHNGTTRIHIGCLPTINGGAQWRFTSPAQGRWYFEWRLKNNEGGWSKWTDGNPTPLAAYHYVDTTDESLDANGPPEDWSVWPEQGPSINSFYIKATRPQTNGLLIPAVVFQFKDVTTGNWEALDGNNGTSSTYYDGSGEDHVYDPTSCTISKNNGNFGTAANNGGLLLVDVRGDGANFNANYCRWIFTSANQYSGNVISGIPALKLAANANTSNIRVKVVRPLSEWGNNGYQGMVGVQSMTFYDTYLDGGRFTKVFQSGLFTLPNNVAFANLGARVFFDNDWSIGDDATYSGNLSTINVTLPNELPLGCYTNFLDGRYWERHPGKWVSVVPHSNNAEFSIVGCANTSNLSVSEVGALIFRPTILPDINGEIQIDVGLTVQSYRHNLFEGAIFGFVKVEYPKGIQDLRVYGIQTSCDNDILRPPVMLEAIVPTIDVAAGITSYASANAWFPDPFPAARWQTFMNNGGQIGLRFSMTTGNGASTTDYHKWEVGVSCYNNGNYITTVYSPANTNFRLGLMNAPRFGIGGITSVGYNNHTNGQGVKITAFCINKGIIIGSPELVGQYTPDSPSVFTNTSSGGDNGARIVVLTAR